MSYIKPATGLPKAAKDMLVPENIRAGVRIKSNGVDVTGSYTGEPLAAGVAANTSSYTSELEVGNYCYAYLFGSGYNPSASGVGPGNSHTYLQGWNGTEWVNLAHLYGKERHIGVEKVLVKGYEKVRAYFYCDSRTSYNPYSSGAVVLTYT